MAETVTVGLVGAGGLGTILGEMFQESNTSAVVALADVSAQSRERAGTKLGVPAEHRYELYTEMLEELELDAVAIATPHTLHYDQVRTCLDAGLDVLCEKPLTTSLEHARELRDRSESQEETLMVGYQRHLEPAFARAQGEVQSWDAEPSFLTAEITQNWLETQSGSWRTNPDLSGGGQLYDTGSHLLDVVLWTTGLQPKSVSAEMKFEDDAERVDTQASLSVTFENGCVASIGISGDTLCVREHIHIWSESGCAYVDGRDWSERRFHSIDPDGTEHSPKLPQFIEQNKVEAFLTSVRNRTTPVATARDAFTVTALTEAAYEAARTGERVAVEQP